MSLHTDIDHHLAHGESEIHAVCRVVQYIPYLTYLTYRP